MGGPWAQHGHHALRHVVLLRQACSCGGGSSSSGSSNRGWGEKGEDNPVAPCFSRLSRPARATHAHSSHTGPAQTVQALLRPGCSPSARPSGAGDCGAQLQPPCTTHAHTTQHLGQWRPTRRRPPFAPPPPSCRALSCPSCFGPPLQTGPVPAASEGARRSAVLEQGMCARAGRESERADGYQGMPCACGQRWGAAQRSAGAGCVSKGGP